MNLAWLFPVAAVCSISTPLCLFAESTYLAEITISIDSTYPAKIVSQHDLIKVDGAGRAFLEFRAVMPAAAADEKFNISVRPQAESSSYPQANCCKSNSDGVISGVIQLGSEQYKLHKDEKYYFELTRAGAMVLQGQILSHAYRMADANYWILLYIAIAGSVIQVVEWSVKIWRDRNKKHTPLIT
jgi:hypothetical protein